MLPSLTSALFFFYGEGVCNPFAEDAEIAGVVKGVTNPFSILDLKKQTATRDRKDVFPLL